MPFEPHEVPPEVRVTVDGAEFCAFLRAVKRSADVAPMDETVLSVRRGQLLIETASGGRVMECSPALPATVRVPTATFFQTTNWASDGKVKITGPLELVLRPELGEIGLSHPAPKPKPRTHKSHK
jgi:hypothetical protein